MNKEFKVGDPVYYPAQGTQVFHLEGNSGLYYPLAITFYDDDGDENFDTFTLEGFYSRAHKAPLIFHATPENKAKLDALYGVEFEEPPSKPTSKEIVKAYLDRGDKSVCCWASTINEQPKSINKWVFIEQVIDGDYPFVDKGGRYWKHATPFDHTTLEPITELPKGELRC